MDSIRIIHFADLVHFYGKVDNYELEPIHIDLIVMGVIVSGKPFDEWKQIWILQTDCGKEMAWFLIRLL